MNNHDFEEIIKYSFRDKTLLEKALTHSSYCREHDIASKDSNERLEFLGDAYFDAVISEELYKRLDKVDEGRLTKTRALIVCEKSLASVARRIHVGEYLNLGKGEEQSGGRNRESILADALEAIVAAIYLDGGFDAMRNFVSREFEQAVEDALSGKLFADYKTHVQEVLQKRGKNTKIKYVTDREEGPDHDKTFYVHLVCDGVTMGRGSGKTKKEAEQNAAKETLEGRYKK